MHLRTARRKGLSLLEVVVSLAIFLMALIGQTKGYLPTVSTFQWAIVTCVYNLGYVALLMRTPNSEAPAAANGRGSGQDTRGFRAPESRGMWLSGFR